MILFEWIKIEYICVFNFFWSFIFCWGARFYQYVTKRVTLLSAYRASSNPPGRKRFVANWTGFGCLKNIVWIITQCISAHRMHKNFVFCEIWDWEFNIKSVHFLWTFKWIDIYFHKIPIMKKHKMRLLGKVLLCSPNSVLMFH